MAKRVKSPPSELVSSWSEVRFWQFLRSALRRAWSRYPNRYEALKLAKRSYKGSNKLQRFEYQCAGCKKCYQQKLVSVDHIVPCGSLKCWEDLIGFCQRLFCAVTGLQILCKTCHSAKTVEENETRREALTGTKLKVTRKRKGQ